MEAENKTNQAINSNYDFLSKQEEINEKQDNINNLCLQNLFSMNERLKKLEKYRNASIIVFAMFLIAMVTLSVTQM